MNFLRFCQEVNYLRYIINSTLEGNMVREAHIADTGLKYVPCLPLFSYFRFFWILLAIF